MRSKEDTDVQRNLFKVKILFLPVQKGKTKHLTAAGLPNFILMCVSYSMPRHSPIACVLMLLPGSQERQNMRQKIMACAIKIATKIWCFGEEERLSWKWLSTFENWLIYGRIRFRENKNQSNFLRATILPHNLQLSFPCKMDISQQSALQILYHSIPWKVWAWNNKLFYLDFTKKGVDKHSVLFSFKSCNVCFRQVVGENFASWRWSHLGLVGDALFCSFFVLREE